MESLRCVWEQPAPDQLGQGLVERTENQMDLWGVWGLWNSLRWPHFWDLECVWYSGSWGRLYYVVGNHLFQKRYFLKVENFFANFKCRGVLGVAGVTLTHICSVAILLSWSLDKQMSIRLFKLLDLRKKWETKKLGVVGSFHFVSMVGGCFNWSKKSMPASLTFHFSSQSAVDMGDETLSNEV